MERNANLQHNESKACPVDPVKIFDQVKLENQGAPFRCLNSMQGFLSNAHWFYNLTIFKKPKLLMGNRTIQERFEPLSNDF